jgi:hypothetical protein
VSDTKQAEASEREKWEALCALPEFGPTFENSDGSWEWRHELLPEVRDRILAIAKRAKKAEAEARDNRDGFAANERGDPFDGSKSASWKNGWEFGKALEEVDELRVKLAAAEKVVTTVMPYRVPYTVGFPVRERGMEWHCPTCRRRTRGEIAEHAEDCEYYAYEAATRKEPQP